MLNQLKFILLIFIFLSFGKKHFAQDCEFPTTFKYLEGNNISAKVSLNGNLFFDNPTGAFIPNTYQYPNDISTIGNFNFWLGALDPDGQFQIAANRHPTNLRNDFVAGPIINNNGQLNFDCENFSRLWEVFGFEIKEHIADFNDNGIIDHPIQNIYAYPGQQNPFFENIHGFSLPNTIHGLAPFLDIDNDGIYNPNNGDFPLPDSVDPSIIPGHLIWGIFNDGGTYHSNSGGLPLNAEIHQTLWSFYCNENEHLNNSTFASYKIINKGNTLLDSMYIAYETDPNLGCPYDDYYGSIPDLNTFYFYNRDQLDGYDNDTIGYCGDGVPTFGNNPPVQSISYLNQPMSSIGYYTTSSIGQTFLYQPNSPASYYTYMSGWLSSASGTIPMTTGGAGYNGTQQTYFTFPDHPLDPMGWSLSNLNYYLISFYTISSTYINSLQPNESTKIDLAFTFYSDETLDNNETVDLVYDNTPLIQQAYDNQFTNFCDPYSCSNDCVWTGDADKDSTVTTFDILQIGLNYGATGTIRNHPLIWQPFDSQNWNTSFLNTDLKHTDCNGNGQIDSIDFNESISNFGKSYKTIPSIDVYNSGPELSLHLQDDSDTLFANSGLKYLRVKLNQEEQIAGLAFSVDCDSSILNIFPGNPSSLWDSNQTDPNDIYKFSIIDTEKEKFHCSYVKIDGENSMTQNGYISSVRFYVKDTTHQLIQTFIRIKNIRAMLADGTILDYGSQDFLLNVVNPNGEGIVLENEKLENNSVQIFPNPTSNILNIKMENPSLANFSIFDIYGKKVLEKMEVNQSEVQLSTSDFTSGIYFLKIEIEGKKLVKKFIKM